MRIKVILLLGIIFFLTLPLYIIPNVIETTIQTPLDLSYNLSNRVLTDPAYRYLFSQENKISIDSMTVDGINFIYSKTFTVDKVITISYKTSTIQSIIMTNPYNEKSIYSWSYKFNSGKYPWSRVKAWALNRKVKKAIHSIFYNFKKNVADLTKIYYTNISVTTLTDSTLITIRKNTNDYPSVSEIYSNLDKLQEYAKLNQAKLTNYPMLNVEQNGNEFTYMVALPIDKDLNNTGDIIAKRMLPNGRFLQTDSIFGGNVKITKLSKSLEDYLHDFGYNSPAIPFQSLISDRRMTSDTNNWVTKLYYPIF